MARLLQEGDVIELTTEHRVYSQVPNHFLYANHQGDFRFGKGEVRIEKCNWLAGKYVVTKTCSDGGGTGMGPGDVYPDGHHVFCENCENPSYQVDFYQTGCFTCMIKDIEPIGKAERKWVFKIDTQQETRR